MQPQCLQGDPTKGGNENIVILLLYRNKFSSSQVYQFQELWESKILLLAFKWAAISESSLVEQEGATIAHQKKTALKDLNNCALFNIQNRYDLPDFFLREVSAGLAVKFQVAELRKCLRSNYNIKRKANGVP